MPLELPNNQASLLVRRRAFDRIRMRRDEIDRRLSLTDEEFRIEGDLIVIGPVLDAAAMQALTDDFEAAGLEYFEDYFDLSGNWPEWLVLFARARAPNDA